MAKHIANCQELRFVVFYHAAVWRNVNLAIRESIESVESLVRRYSRSEMHLNLNLSRRHVVNLLNLYLSLFNSLQYRLFQCVGSFAERQVADNESLVVQLLNLCSHLQHTATLTVVVSTDVDRTASREVWIERKRFAL